MQANLAFKCKYFYICVLLCKSTCTHTVIYESRIKYRTNFFKRQTSQTENEN